MTNLPRACPNCKIEAQYGIEDRCRACNYPFAALAPNVQLALLDDWHGRLTERYNQALEAAAQLGLDSAAAILHRVAEQTRTVVNVPLGIAYSLFTRDDLLYSPYAALLAGGVRAPAATEHDRQRRGVDALLYGSFSDTISFGALSANGLGVTSYGPCHLQLAESTVSYRASILEENSYHFIERHSLTPHTPFPKGHLSSWKDRAKLAVAKLACQLQADADFTQCQAKILCSEGDKQQDLFFEVHIYGNFNWQAVEHVYLPSKDELRDAVEISLSNHLLLMKNVTVEMRAEP